MKNQAVIMTTGICYCSVCVPKDMTIEEIEADVNSQSPTGIGSSWKISKDKNFVTGQTNPCVCEQDKERMHYLLSC